MTAAIQAINDNPPRSNRNNNFGNFFRSIVDGLQKLCCCTSRQSDDRQSPKTSTKHEEGAYVESVLRQQEASQNKTVADVIKEDEEFARQLQEEDKQNKVKVRLKKPSQAFPEVHKTPGKVAVIEPLDEKDSAIYSTATFYRDEADKRHRKRREYYQIAKRHLKAKNRQQAHFYFELAREQKRLIEQANNFAAAAFLAENNERHSNKDTIDLHHLYVKEAIQALDIFLDDEILSLRNEDFETKHLMVVTGRGKHSQDGIPKIKPAVKRRLEQRSLAYTEINPGCLKVRISQCSHLTNDLN